MTRQVDIGQRIRDDVAAGHLLLGARLTIDELASRYQASHMPIREALRQLQGEGLVVLEPNRGARVRSVDRAFVINLFATRGAIEALLGRQAALNCSVGQLAALHLIETHRLQCVAAGDFPAALARNRAFHQAINAAAQNPHATGLVDQHWVLIAALWHRYGYGEDRFAGVASDHQNLLRAMAAHDGEAAGAIMNAHVIKAKFEMLARMAAAEPRQAAA